MKIFKLVLQRFMNKFLDNPRGVLFFILGGSFLLRLGFLVIMLILKKPAPAEDEINYFEGGQRLLEQWLHNTDISNFQFLSMDRGYYYYNAFIDYLFGSNMAWAQFINIIFFVFGSFYFYKMVEVLFESKIARITLLITSFYPSLIFWSTRNTKEAISFFLASVIFYNFIYLFLIQFHMKRLLLLYSFLFVFLSFREYIASFLGFLCGASFFFYFLRVPSLKYKKILFFITIAITSFSIFILYQYVNDRSKGMHITQLFHYFSNIRQNSCLGIHQVYPLTDISSLSSFILFLPKALFLFFMAPVQFLFTRSLTPFEKSILIEIIPWILGLLYFPKGIYISLKGADLNKFLTLGVIFIFMLTFTLLYSTVNCNLGTLYRFKGILLPFYFMFMANGLYHLKSGTRGFRDSALTFSIHHE